MIIPILQMREPSLSYIAYGHIAQKYPNGIKLRSVLFQSLWSFYFASSKFLSGMVEGGHEKKLH